MFLEQELIENQFTAFLTDCPELLRSGDGKVPQMSEYPDFQYSSFIPASAAVFCGRAKVVPAKGNGACCPITIPKKNPPE